jgi:hypothetical protein
MAGRRLAILLVVLAVAAIPAIGLRAVCAGDTCANNDVGQARVPFCPLPGALKADLVAGYREGRSPDVLAVSAHATILGGTDPADAAVPWPRLGAAETTGVPIVFAGTGVDPSFAVPSGTGLDQIAPTISDIIGLRRPHPSVRAGVAINGLPSGEHPRLVLEIALKGVGAADLMHDRRAWPYVLSLMHRGAGTLHGSTGSLPVDPTTTLTTIGTGGLPYQHGVTGTFIRNDEGRVVRAFGAGAPPTVIAALPDDLDHATDQRARIGLVQTDPADRGLIGKDWYVRHGTPVVVTAPEGAVAAARSVLASGFGRDDVPDVLGVVLEPRAGEDTELRELVASADRAAGGSVLVVVAGTGTTTASVANVVPARVVVADVEDAVEGDAPVVAAAVPGGLFLDQATLAAEGITGQAAATALLDVTTPDGQRMMADAFQGFAVSFARYC